MSRAVGSKNKSIINNLEMDNEDIFLKNAVDNYTFWKGKIKELEQAGKDASKEKEYAQAFKVQLNAFTQE